VPPSTEVHDDGKAYQSECEAEQAELYFIPEPIRRNEPGEKHEGEPNQADY
jgi:hypothetical protein